MEKWKESSSKSYEGMQEVEKMGWIKAERRWNSKLYHDKKWQALMNHCSHNCLGSDGCEMFKIWLNRLKYKSPLKAAHAVIDLNTPESEHRLACQSCVSCEAFTASREKWKTFA